MDLPSRLSSREFSRPSYLHALSPPQPRTDHRLDYNPSCSAVLRYKIYEPILTVGVERFQGIDIRLRVKGGGHVSQIYALRQAIAKGVVA